MIFEERIKTGCGRENQFADWAQNPTGLVLRGDLKCFNPASQGFDHIFAQAQRDNSLVNICQRITTGNDFPNRFWQPCNAERKCLMSAVSKDSAFGQSSKYRPCGVSWAPVQTWLEFSFYH